MKHSSDTAVFDQFLEQEYPTPEERAAFERRVANLVATSNLINALEDVRKASGVSKAEIARRIGSERSVVSRLLAGKGANPTFTTVADIADALGVYLDIRVKPQPRKHRHAPIEVDRSATEKLEKAEARELAAA